MKNQELYNRSVDVLQRAWKDNILQSDHCAFCAVGCLVANGTGKDLLDEEVAEDWFPAWSSVFMTNACSRTQVMDMGAYKNLAKEEIDSTGYTVRELSQIEYAFETGAGKDNDVHSGLMEVLDVLGLIHEVDASVTTAQKNRFTKLQSAPPLTH